MIQYKQATTKITDFQLPFHSDNQACFRVRRRKFRHERPYSLLRITSVLFSDKCTTSRRKLSSCHRNVLSFFASLKIRIGFGGDRFVRYTYQNVHLELTYFARSRKLPVQDNAP
jgi:hypothetical protein